MFNSAKSAILGTRRIVVEAGAVMDAAGVFARPGSLAISEDGRVVFAGPPAGVPAEFRGDGTLVLRLPDRLLVPGMVNAHAHLDLSVHTQWPYGGNFLGWIQEVMAWRQRWTPAQDSLLGAARHLAGSGVAAVGDIASADAVDMVEEALEQVGVAGVVFAEQFGHDACARDRELSARKPSQTPQPCEQQPGGQHARGPGRKRGIQPHAPYSAGPALFEAACKSGLPLSTHLAETPEEAQFVGSATGPFRDLLERMGKWHPEIAANYSAGLSPVRWMEPYLRQVPWLLAHVNYADDADLAILARTGASVAYCPVASDYFLHKNHRYRDMLAAGINVCLGTDSAICQPAGEAQPLGILPQMRHLFRRDQVEAQVLLKMATVNGTKALGLAPDFATFTAGAQAMPVALKFDLSDSLDPLAQALRRGEPAESLLSFLP